MLAREAAKIREHDHAPALLATALTSLGRLLLKRYQFETAETSVLEEAVDLHRTSLQLCPRNHPDRIGVLVDLATSLSTRFSFLTGDALDLDEALSLGYEALELTARGDCRRREVLAMLSQALALRFDLTGDRIHISNSIANGEAALNLYPESHFSRTAALEGLAMAHLNRYLGGRDKEDLDRSILLFRDRLEHPPSNLVNTGPTSWLSVVHLSRALIRRYEDLGDVNDIHEAIDILGKGTASAPRGHLCHTYFRVHFAEIWLTVQGRSPGLSSSFEIDAPTALQYLINFVEDKRVPAAFHLTILKPWILGPIADPHIRLLLHSRFQTCLQRVLVTDASLIAQQDQLSQYSSNASLVSLAAADAVEAGELERAVELLDHGRSLLFSVIQRYRTPVSDLRAAGYHTLSDSIESIGNRLERLSAASSKGPLIGLRRDHSLSAQRRLLEEWDSLVKEARGIEGYEDFLSITPYHKLQLAANHGPIILLNAHEKRCDAIIISSSGPPCLVPLPNVSTVALKEYNKELQESRFSNSGTRTREEAVLVRILQSLWADVVEPVSQQLSTMNVPPNSRVWWCPTSSFSLLPLHAAGPYNRLSGGPFITRWVSSYTTTIADLLGSKSQRKPSINQRRLLFVGHAGGNLEAVRDEARVVDSVEGVESSLLLEEGATADSVLKQLPDFSWVHLSCHGFAIGDRPLDSYFQLDDRELTVKDIIESRVGNAELAFLSACHSAASGTHIPDENIHLAAALNLAGFRSIVGSLWEVWDGEGPAVSGLFYKKLMKRGGRYTDAAEALHYALLSRWKHGASLQRWAMFIHMGA